jgi:hypothetical protein
MPADFGERWRPILTRSCSAFSMTLILNPDVSTTSPDARVTWKVLTVNDKSIVSRLMRFRMAVVYPLASLRPRGFIQTLEPIKS